MAAILSSKVLGYLPKDAYLAGGTAVASQLDLSLMKIVAINQRGTCKDFMDLKILIEANKYTFEGLMDKLSEKYNIGNEMHFQLKKSLVYFDDAEKDLNILMYGELKESFEILGQEDWKATRVFFERFVKSAFSARLPSSP
ncbi:MAG: hypothetical protein ABIK98_14065 [Pseudomonadota bacterium]